MNKVESSGFIFIAEEKKFYAQEKISEEIASVIRKIEKERLKLNNVTNYTIVWCGIIYYIQLYNKMV